MGTTADKLQNIVDTKASIKTAIENKGITVGDIPFAQYPSKIAEISSVRSSVSFTNTFYESTAEKLITSGTRTYIATFKTPAELATDAGFIFAQNANSGMRLQTVNGNLLQGWIGSQGFTFTGITLATNTMYQVLLEYNKVTGNLIGAVNGVNTDTNNFPDASDAPTIFSVGNITIADLYFQYALYNLRVFNYILNATERTTIWNNGQPDAWVMPDTWRIPSPSNYYKSDFSTGVNGWSANASFGGSVTHGDNSINVNLPAPNVTNIQLYRYSIPTTAEPCHIYVEVVTNDTNGVTTINALPFNGSRDVSLTPLNRGDGTILWYGNVELRDCYNYSYLNISGTAGTTFTIYSIEFTSVGCVAEYLPPYLYSNKWIDTSLQNNYLVEHVSNQSGGAN